MGTSASLSNKHREHIERQSLFFVATAAPEGRVNLSPKGMDTLRIVNDRQIVWLNLSGSGNETAAHLLELPRMTMMFCAFEGDPLILRVYGSAVAIHPRDETWQQYIDLFPEIAGSRQIFVLDIDLVQTSCGTGVPVMQLVEERAATELAPYYEKMGQDGVEKYWRRKNAVSIDGKPTGTVVDAG